MTVSRYCASSLEAIRQAANAVARRRGRHLHRRGRRVGQPLQRAPGGGRRRGPEREPPGQERPARRLHRDGPDRGERRRQVGGEPRRHGQVRAALAGAGRRSRRSRASSTARSSRSSFPTAPRSRRDDGPRADSTLEKLSQLKPAFSEDGKVTAGNSCPLNDGAAAVLDHVRHAGEGARPAAARPDHRRGDRRRSSRSSWASRRSARSRRCSTAPA